MKTTASVVKKSPVVSFPNGKRVQTTLNPDGELTIKHHTLGKWIDSINKTNGVFFLHLDTLSEPKHYSIHYKCHKTGKMLEMVFKKSSRAYSDSKKSLFDALLLDLDLFEGNEPIVVFNKNVFENHLQELFPILYAQTDALDSILGRMIDLKEVFDTRMYYDTLFREASVKEIHRVLYGHSQKETIKIPDSLAMYQIFDALQSIYFQVTGLRVIA